MNKIIWLKAVLWSWALLNDGSHEYFGDGDDNIFVYGDDEGTKSSYSFALNTQVNLAACWHRIDT